MVWGGHGGNFFLNNTFFYTFMVQRTIHSHFPRCQPKKLVSTMTYEPLVGLH